MQISTQLPTVPCKTGVGFLSAECSLHAGFEVLLPHPKHNPFVPETMMCQELDQTKLFINQQLKLLTPRPQCTNHSSLSAAALCQDFPLREAQAQH